MHKSTPAFALMIATFALGSAVASPQRAATAIDAPQAIERVTAAGYTDIRGVEADDGVWELRATGTDGRRVTVYVDGADGTILSPAQPGQAPLDLAQVMSRLAAAGYADVREVERDDGYWKAEVRTSAGIEREVRVHPLSGAIVDDRIDF
jgi:uncharacterized membrane protein YkoI